jgi:hypothetical protein
MTVYYLTGPMAKYPKHNHPAFHRAATELRNQGHSIISPADYGSLVTGWRECMKRDLHALLWCDAVIVLPKWDQSKGATLEANQAVDLQMPVYDLQSMLADEPEQIPLHVIKRAYYAIHVSAYIEYEIEVAQ